MKDILHAAIVLAHIYFRNIDRVIIKRNSLSWQFSKAHKHKLNFIFKRLL